MVPDFRLNRAFDALSTLSGPQKAKVEFLCNECCWFGCKDRKRCYEAVSRKSGTTYRKSSRFTSSRNWRKSVSTFVVEDTK